MAKKFSELRAAMSPEAHSQASEPRAGAIAKDAGGSASRAAAFHRQDGEAHRRESVNATQSHQAMGRTGGHCAVSR